MWAEKNAGSVIWTWGSCDDVGAVEFDVFDRDFEPKRLEKIGDKQRHVFFTVWRDAGIAFGIYGGDFD